MKLKVLHHIPNLESLQALVHASPTMHELYVTDRERYYTRATLKELLAKGVDVLDLATFLLVDLDYARPSLLAGLEPAFEALHHQLRHRKGNIRLKLDHCKILRRIRMKFLFEVDWEELGQFGKPQVIWLAVPNPRSRYWCIDDSAYPQSQIIYLGDESKDAVQVQRSKTALREEFEETRSSYRYHLEEEEN